MTYIDQERFARHLPLFGDEGQKKLNSITVVLVGYGGLGTHVLPQLILLGIRKIIVIEPETFDTTNRGRYMGFRHDDIGIQKGMVAERVVKSIDPDCDILVVHNRLESRAAFEAIGKADVIVGCLDSDGARAILNELSIAYKKPYIDLASEVFPDGAYGGRVAVVKDGNGCLSCMGGGLDQTEVTAYLTGASELENKAAIYGVDIEHLKIGSGPSVVSINGAVASLGVIEFQAMVTGIRSPFRFLNFRGHLQTIAKGELGRSKDCYFCQSYGKPEKLNVERYIAT